LPSRANAAITLHSTHQTCYDMIYAKFENLEEKQMQAHGGSHAGAGGHFDRIVDRNREGMIRKMESLVQPVRTHSNRTCVRATQHAVPLTLNARSCVCVCVCVCVCREAAGSSSTFWSPGRSTTTRR
jgi:hypothetical protein